MTSQWGYVDPVQRVHQQRAMRGMYQPQPQQYVQPERPLYSLEPVQSPLAGLNQAAPEIMYAAGYRRYRNVREDMVAGAVLGGLLGWVIARRREVRRQRKAAPAPGALRPARDR